MGNKILELLKKKFLIIIGSISALLGSIGVVVATWGLCACVLVPTFSLLGITSIVFSFLSEEKVTFLSAGIVFLLLSLVFYFKKKKCKKHG
tara:strand:- start:139 stop:411 length:273 start_codon:yes stop_codon:yes gene_type:complete